MFGGFSHPTWSPKSAYSSGYSVASQNKQIVKETF